MLESWCQVKGLTLANGLIQNDKPITLEEARGVICYALRWRIRQCRLCDKDFDIMTGGFLYCCDECAPAEV
tara:strand:- start:13801 stop:14013 length:213 start_codon:yes stop_codon:yes gene_type:complete